MTQPQIGSFEHIPLAAIRPSTTNPRKHFDPAALEELTNSVRELGVTVPIHVRSADQLKIVIVGKYGRAVYKFHGNGNPKERIASFESQDEDQNRFDAEDFLAKAGPGVYEIVTGERRFRAATAAGLAEIPAIVHDGLDDEDAMDLQLVENLQRADLHPVEEADGYRALMAHGESAEDVAKKAGKTLGYVQQRLKLLTLEVDAKQLFLDKHLTLDHALMLARLTPKDQERALLFLLGIRDWELDKKKTVSENIASETKKRAYGLQVGGGRMVSPTAQQLKDWISSHVLLVLKGVPWDLGDAELVPIAGPCTTCPKRTGANQALFADLTTVEDTCVDRACFADKQKAFTLRAQQLAKEQGSPLLKISAKSSTEKLEKPAVEIRASAVKMQGNKAVETKRAVVVATRPVKQGQWIAAKKGSCPSTVQAIAVDGPEQGKLKWVCADQSCKVHPRHVTKPHTEERVDRNMNSPENRAKREAEEAIEKKVNEAIVAEILEGDAKEAIGKLILFVVEQLDGWAGEIADLCLMLDLAVPGYKAGESKDWQKRNAAHLRAKPIFTKFIEEATLPELQETARAVLVLHAQESYDDSDMPLIAAMFDVDPKSIEKTVRAKLAAEAKAAAPAPPAAKKATKKVAKKKGGK